MIGTGVSPGAPPPSTSSGGGVYKSLTGPGETATPGTLTQAGDLHVNAVGNVDINAPVDINLTSASPTAGEGVFVDVSNGGEFQVNYAQGVFSINDTGAGEVEFACTSGHFVVATSAAGSAGNIGLSANNDLNLGAGVSVLIDGPDVVIFNNAGGCVILIGHAGDAVGFYGATPVVKAGAPSTLADVITILTNLGLCS